MDLVTPKTPEEILPLEVWGLILDHLRSPSDLRNCNKVCKAWRKILKLKKTTFLMPKVFPILYKYLQSIEANDEDDEDENEEEKESTITTILKMRLVSHGWKESVDNCHQNHPALNDMGLKKLTLQINGNEEPFPLLPYRFGNDGESKSVEKLESFLVKGFSPDGNPFITRHVRYSECGDDEQDLPRILSLQTAFKNMLEVFGSQIWTCELHFDTLATSKADIYKHVGSYLRLMPNLRSLKVRFFMRHDNVSSEKEGLDLLLENEPFPRLEHLTTLEMSGVPYPLSVGLLKTNGHLQKLEFQKTDIDDEPLLPDNIATVQLRSLEGLTFPWCQTGLLNFSSVCWPIKVLNLKVGEVKLENIFQALSSAFCNTLEQFVLTRNLPLISDNNEELKQIKLELPKLRIFQLNISSELETIDFLKGCTALQEIQLAFYVLHTDKEGDEDSSSSFPTNEDEEDNAVIKFKDCINSMNQPNIWRILDNLQSIKIKTKAIETCWDEIPMIIHPVKARKFTRCQFEKISNSN